MRVRISRITVIGPLRVSVIELHAHSSTRMLSQPGPPVAMVVTHQWAARRYGIARSIAGIPQYVAEFLNVSQATLSRWRREKVGPPFLQVGGVYRYTPATVRTWVSEQEARHG